MTHWHLITGEYPPQPGGIGDYCERLAHALAAAGCDLHVWCPAAGGSPPAPASLNVHRLERGFGVAGLRELDRALGGHPGPRTLLVQYAPNALGMRGVNFAFCIWLMLRARHDEVRVMFHEPYYYFDWQRPSRNALAAAHRVMAVLLLGASHTVYIASETWRRYLRPYLWLGSKPFVWMPIPATIPRVETPDEVARLRSTLLRGGATVLIGHFGTYGGLIRPHVTAVLESLLTRHPQVSVLCLGRNSDVFVTELVDARPSLRGRLLGGGFMSPEEISLHLQACDLLVQPYPDGVTSRRTSAMAVLANGVALVTNTGPLTESLWRATDGVALAPSPSVSDLAETTAALLANPKRRTSVGSAGRRLYEECFAIHNVVRLLTVAPSPPAKAARPA